MESKCSEAHSEKKSSMKFSKGQISLDSIPLNWGKHPMIQPILKIIKMCMGPYGMNNNFSEL